jgi:hypothetical protein
MLKWTASSFLNHLFVLAMIWFAITTYSRTSCDSKISYVKDLKQAMFGLKEVARALQ